MGKTRQLILTVLMSVFLCALFSGCGAGSNGQPEAFDLEAYSSSGAEADTPAVADNGKHSNADPSETDFVPMAAPSYILTTDDGPLGPDFIEYETDCWFNEKRVMTAENYPGPAGTVTNFSWRVIGDTKFCLMVLIDTQNDFGGGNYSLIVPGYDIPEIMKRGEYIYITWSSLSSPSDRISLMFIEGTNYMVISENARTGVIQEPDSDIIELAVPIREEGSGEGLYYIPIYAIINEVGGGVMFDPFDHGKAFIYTGDTLQGYTGYWEVADETEYRVDVDINGETVSVGNYKWAMTLRPDGTFTEHDRYYQDEGDWIRNEKNGEFVFFGRVLAQKYMTETEYRGKDFNNLELAKKDEPIVEYGTEDGLALYVRYIDDWDPAEVLSIRGYRVLYSQVMSGWTW